MEKETEGKTGRRLLLRSCLYWPCVRSRLAVSRQAEFVASKGRRPRRTKGRTDVGKDGRTDGRKTNLAPGWKEGRAAFRAQLRSGRRAAGAGWGRGIRGKAEERRNRRFPVAFFWPCRLSFSGTNQVSKVFLVTHTLRLSKRQMNQYFLLFEKPKGQGFS